ncbi:MAG TPA: hypothetical protein VHD63_03185 [Ktedonobacteraceae bacterium]|nr:hypothetical protein [Ktedonobacteraceae bacterium]
MTTSNAQTVTYATTTETEEITVTSNVMTQATALTKNEQIARYFIQDLTHFIRLTSIDLIKELEIPPDPDYSGSQEDVLALLYEDLTHMLREGLITGIHLLLSESQPDQNTGRYLLRYHATYTINQTQQGQRRLQADVRRFGGDIAPPAHVWEKARFALLIDWSAADERRRQVHRPRYFFDWVPPNARFDARSLVRYREGGLTYNGAVVVDRAEARSPGYPVNE